MRQLLANNIVCEVCGDIGYRQLLLCCGDCKRYAVHQYCLDKVVFDATLLEWFCYECLQRRGEVTCVASLEQVSSESPLSHAHFGPLVHQRTTKRVESVTGPYSPSDDCEELFSYPGIESIPSVQEISVDPIKTSSISEHDTIEAAASSERFTECQKASSCREGITVKMAMAPSSYENSGEDIFSENVFLEYVLAYKCYLSKAQKKRVMELIQEIQPEFTVFISIMRRGNVRPPGPFLGINKEYANAHFPDKSTNVTLEMPDKSKKWHPKFYRRDVSRTCMLTGQWLDFVCDNHVQEGDICLLLPTKDEIRCTFMVYVLHETTHSSRGEAGFQMGGPCPGASGVASEIHVEEEPTTGEHVSSESDMREIPHESLSRGDSDDQFEPPYFVPCKSPLSESQKRMVEERVRAIRSEIPICVAVMKNNNVGVAQRWMLELGSRYGSVYLPTKGQTILLQCGGTTWKAKLMFHNGRRWFLNGGWPNFARGNGLRVGDICLFELKKKDSKLTMAVHIIRREKF
uniref:TF-B3 domain-containing protein n=1 Tax=Zea mays TaxID=4577 RepID=A0A804M161_MAIZE